VIRPVAKFEDFARDHLEAMHIGSEVTRWFRKEREPHVLKVTPENVVAALHKAGINAVLMGTHGLNGYRAQPRATQHVDVLVTKKDVRKAIRVLDAAFPHMEIHENAAVARFLDPVTQKVVLDVMKPSSRFMHLVFRHTVPIGETHRIPDLEMGLVSKFAAMVAPNRAKERKIQDTADFAAIVTHHREHLDLKKLRRLAANVYPGRGAEIVRLVEDICSNRDITL
jgi:hypothetical protein